MKANTKNLPLCCKSVDFGKVRLSRRESAFYRHFSKEMLSLCRSMPESAQTDSILFLMNYSGIRLGDDLDFFAGYYPPVWSILYWLLHSDRVNAKRLKKADVAHAVRAHSMSMFLHSLDDHLMDSQVSVSPLTLLLRNQAWAIMSSCFSNLARTVRKGERTVRRFIDDYYTSLQDPRVPESLDDYCDLFKKQMALGMIAPTLLSMKGAGISDFTTALQVAYGSFGIAWRLLDDIRDMGEDIEKRSRSSIYLCLPDELKTRWDNDAGRGTSTNAILTHILEHRLIEKIKEKICAELDGAASIVESHKITGLAREFRCLADPFRESRGTQEEDNARNGLSLASK